MAQTEGSLADIIERLETLTEDNDEVSAGDLSETFGARGYGPFLIVPSLIGLTPIGAIPVVPTFLAVPTAIFAVQMLIGRRQLSLPQVLAKRRIDSERIRSGVDKMRPVAERLDRWFHGRLAVFVRSPFDRVAAVICLLLCAMVPPLELLPFAAMVPFSAILVFGLALSVRDGVLMIAAVILSLAALGTFGYFAIGGQLFG